MHASRRRFLNYAGAVGLVPLSTHCGDGENGGAQPDADPPAGIFLHGVASGDPAADAVILWTRVTIAEQADEVEVEWLIARDVELADVVSSGALITGPEQDYTVKVDAGGLEPGTTYYYRFRAAGEDSVVGRTRTLPSGSPARLRFAVVSCSNHPAGYFNAYAFVARRADLDAVLHLGDYIYEYGTGEFGDSGLPDRVSDPVTEILTLEDYRRRHAQYKRDPDLQEAHRQHVFIAVWDDHEIANNAWRDGADNHQPEDDGDYADRKAAGLRAYLEWMPVRAAGDAPVFYRSFRFGDLAELCMLDTRHAGRDLQVIDACDFESIEASERQLLGQEQETWLFDELVASHERGDRWRLLGQQVMVGQLRNVLASGNCPINPDQWDGYGSARQRLLSTIADNGIDNVVVLTGDIHSSWAIDLAPDPFDPELYDAESGGGSLAVEAVAPSVTSPGLGSDSGTMALAELVRDTHPHMKHIDLYQHGYVLLDVTPRAVQAEWYYLSTVLERGGEESLGASFVSASGANHFAAAEGPSAPRDDAPAPAP